jgi:hypothetical protein
MEKTRVGRQAPDSTAGQAKAGAAVFLCTCGVLWTRAPELDKRIRHGDDFAGDAWRGRAVDRPLQYTAVGHAPSSPCWHCGARVSLTEKGLALLGGRERRRPDHRPAKVPA